MEKNKEKPTPEEYAKSVSCKGVCKTNSCHSIFECVFVDNEIIDLLNNPERKDESYKREPEIDTHEYRIAAMKRFIEKSREGITEVEAKIRELGGEVEEEVPFKKMFEFVRWRDDNYDDIRCIDGIWYEWIPNKPRFPNEAGKWKLIAEGKDFDLWKKYQEDKKPKI